MRVKSFKWVAHSTGGQWLAQAAYSNVAMIIIIIIIITEFI